ncbi:hypothetical protein AMS68_006328 [Peltaster fructicola]|uniref:SAGA-associated factor 11 n=1 Tax=Peltaster fructicola TaxID=286661 RepID=A0A6H0Y1M5_9PEZI|nr:hypothetical protein AMS68_006328 [Peltaster fructicola]
MSSDSKESLSQLAQRLFNDALHNILHDIVITRHREHKKLLATIDPADRLPHCDTCNLPRLLDPPLAPKVRGATTDPPTSTTYCDRKPWSQRPGHDIYDNPFPRSDVTGRPPTKKEREAAKNSKKDDNAGEDGQNGGSPPSPNIAGEDQSASTAKLEKGEKKASKIDEKLKKGEYVPWHTCPNCKRSLLITRFAKHLEQCMGLSGRAASRNAMAKMNGSTPGGSRTGTPAPGSQDGKDAEDDDDDIEVKGSKNVRKQLLKKGVDKKIKDQKKLTANGKLSRVSSISGKRSSPAPSTSDGKRDRDEMSNGGYDDDGDEVHVKKRQKMSRVDSQASIGSSTANGTGQDLERAESQDGSFVDDAGSTIDD